MVSVKVNIADATPRKLVQTSDLYSEGPWYVSRQGYRLRFSVFSSAPPGDWQDNTLKQATTASLHIISNVPLISLVYLFWKKMKVSLWDHFPVCLSAYPVPFFARQRLGKHVSETTNTHTTVEEQLHVAFSMPSVLYQILSVQWKGRRRIALPRTSFLLILSFDALQWELWKHRQTRYR